MAASVVAAGAALALLASAAPAAPLDRAGQTTSTGLAVPPSHTITDPFAPSRGRLPATLALSGTPGKDLTLSLAHQLFWRLDGSSPLYTSLGDRGNPRSVQVATCAAGRFLVIADRGDMPGSDINPFVAMLPWPVGQTNPDQQAKWVWTKKDDPDLIGPFSAQLLGDGHVLIADRSSSRVIEVAPNLKSGHGGSIVWQYGVARQLGLTPGHLIDPFAASKLTNGNVLICDNNGGNRVIEVKASDYDPTKADDGYTDASIVWQYGMAGAFGTGPGHLIMAHSAQRLANGDTLIADSDEKSDRVIE
ncbi:MAG TPA: hypothetical protein VK576_08660, partial [Thermoleophilia bacterium]|nr:hypothetical protein [Thermoleophilia bacterium]